MASTNDITPKFLKQLMTAGGIVVVAMIAFYGTGAYLNIMKIRKERQNNS